jgi:hypothetical protein
MTNQDILAIEFESRDLFRKLTIKDYLKELLITLWQEGEGFSSKRPFGNSDWQYDVYQPLIAHGIVAGKLDEEGYIDECDTVAAEKRVLELIASL